tara:strand:+ start:6208 stop:7290 length:1083 start_codon:yes stop_codon:yes gene_type:complete
MKRYRKNNEENEEENEEEKESETITELLRNYTNTINSNNRSQINNRFVRRRSEPSLLTEEPRLLLNRSDSNNALERIFRTDDIDRDVVNTLRTSGMPLEFSRNVYSNNFNERYGSILANIRGEVLERRRRRTSGRMFQPSQTTDSRERINNNMIIPINTIFPTRWRYETIMNIPGSIINNKEPIKDSQGRIIRERILNPNGGNPIYDIASPIVYEYIDPILLTPIYVNGMQIPTMTSNGIPVYDRNGELVRHTSLNNPYVVIERINNTITLFDREAIEMWFNTSINRMNTNSRFVNPMTGQQFSLDFFSENNITGPRRSSNQSQSSNDSNRSIGGKRKRKMKTKKNKKNMKYKKSRKNKI